MTNPIEDTIARLIAEHSARKVPQYVPSESEVADTLEAMAEKGYWPHVDPAATRALAAWIAAYRLGKTRRGLLLYGPPGTGKTLALQLFSGVPIRKASRYVDLWATCNWGESFEELAYGIYREEHVSVPAQPIVIDDLGQEPLGVSFGRKEEVLERVLCDRYSQWQRTGVKTHIATNLSLPAIQARYGKRVLDRLGDMCLWIEFTGKSARTGE